ncbi:hypothetical protein NUACC21_13520 [Scytonema sp. NUACC21]
MENTQSVQQQASQAEAPTPGLRKKKSKKPASKNFLIDLFAKYPLLLPVGLSAIFLGSGVLALYSLGHVESPEEEEVETLEAEVVKPITTPTETANPMPLWMVIAIALSCGSGSLMLFLLLNRPAQRQMVKNHFNRYQARLTQRSQRMEPRPPKNKPVYVPSKVRQPAVAMSVQAQPVVTILPPEQNSSRNSNEESLASVFDIRKHTPLSTIIRKN